MEWSAVEDKVPSTAEQLGGLEDGDSRTCKGMENDEPGSLGLIAKGELDQARKS